MLEQSEKHRGTENKLTGQSGTEAKFYTEESCWSLWLVVYIGWLGHKRLGGLLLWYCFIIIEQKNVLFNLPVTLYRILYYICLNTFSVYLYPNTFLAESYNNWENSWENHPKWNPKPWQEQSILHIYNMCRIKTLRAVLKS